MPAFQAAGRDGLSTTFHGKYSAKEILAYHAVVCLFRFKLIFGSGQLNFFFLSVESFYHNLEQMEIKFRLADCHCYCVQ